jgi:hypothetical protein
VSLQDDRNFFAKLVGFRTKHIYEISGGKRQALTWLKLASGMKRAPFSQSQWISIPAMSVFKTGASTSFDVLYLQLCETIVNASI